MTLQAAVLVGGLAMRMLPRTEACPKALLPVAGRPLLAWKLEALARAGFDEVVLCVGHLGDQVRAFAGDGRAFGLTVRCSDDGDVARGTAGALRRAGPLLADTFLVTYGDSYLPFDYAAPLRDLRAHPDALGTLAVYENGDRWDRSNARVEGDRVTRYAKHHGDPSLRWIDYGAMALRREVLARVAADGPSGLEVLQGDLAREGRLRAFRAAERFFEIGSPAGLVELDRWLGARAAATGCA